MEMVFLVLTLSAVAVFIAAQKDAMDRRLEERDRDRA